MLKFKVNTRDAKYDLEKIDVKNIEYNTNTQKINIECVRNHNLLPSDIIYFRKECGDNVIFQESKIPIIKNNNFSSFSIDVFPDYNIYPSQIVEVKSLKANPFRNETNDYLCFVFDSNKPHYFYECRDVTIKESIYPQDSYEEILNNGIRRRCPNDYIIYNKIFLYRAEKNTNNTFYDIENENYLNTIGDFYFIKENGTKIELKNCIVPVTNSGNDSRQLLYWKIDDIDVAEYIKAKYNVLNFYCEDTRFIDENLKLKDNVSIYKEIGNIKINIPFEEHIETNMFQYERYNGTYIESIKSENINPIVDMEKQIFIPQINNKNVKKIVFNLHFRKRGTQTVIEDIDNGWKENIIQNEWWNTNINDSDLLGYLGFTDNDVYYQKNKLKKSFIRLSFYDSKDRLKQNLLYYSTIFIDSGIQYGKYCKNIAENSTYFDNGNAVMVLDKTTVSNTLNSQLTISDNFDTTASSEGYFLYLFPDNLTSEGRTIYMKVEFNHAKYGVTIPMMNQKKESGYMTSETKDTKGIEEMLSDLYTEIKIGYNAEKKEYYWNIYTDKNIENNNINFEEVTGTINLNFFEPIVYK